MTTRNPRDPRLIKLYAYPGELVLDPFVGSGQTLKVAHHLGRRFVGYETIDQYVALALAVWSFHHRDL